MKPRPLDIWTNKAKFPNLSVPQFVIERAIKSLEPLEAISLIRGAYNTEKCFASFKEANEIYRLILNERRTT